MYDLEQRKRFAKKVEDNRELYELKGEYEDHEPVRCFLTDLPAVHKYHTTADRKKYYEAWAVAVPLSNGEVITCLACDDCYSEEDVKNDTLVVEEERTVRSIAWVMEFKMTESEYEAFCQYENETREMLMEEFKKQLSDARYIGTFRATRSDLLERLRRG